MRPRAWIALTLRVEAQGPYDAGPRDRWLHAQPWSPCSEGSHVSHPFTTGHPRSGAKAPRTPCWHRFVARLLRNFYFRVRVVGSPCAARPRTLVVSSHRNGAIDGYLVLAAFPRAVFLASAQLLRNPWLRLMFAGIPVVRAKDAQRHHLDPQRFASPVSATLSCLEQGSCVALFPEGTSCWGPKPLPYAQGAALVACLSWLRPDGHPNSPTFGHLNSPTLATAR